MSSPSEAEICCVALQPSGWSADDTANRFASVALWQSISVPRNKVLYFVVYSIPVLGPGTLVRLSALYTHTKFLDGPNSSLALYVFSYKAIKAFHFVRLETLLRSHHVSSADFFYYLEKGKQETARRY
jgi:hypothetical protein